MAAPTNNMHNLTTLIRRLEAATLRLEDIASSTVEIPQAVPALAQTTRTPPVDGAAKSIGTPTPTATPMPKSTSGTPVPPLPSAPAAAASPANEPLPDSIEDFDEFLQTSVARYAKLSTQLGGAIAQQAAKVIEGFSEQRKFLLITTKAKKPNLSNDAELKTFQKLIEPTNNALMAVQGFKDQNRGSPFTDQLSAVAEGIMCLAWVTVERKPANQVDETLGSAQYYGNRVLKEHKEKDPQQVEWMRAYFQIFKDLSEYIKQHFANGIPWNGNGVSAADALNSVAAPPVPSAAPTPKAAAGGPAPPPPPPPGPAPVIQIKEQQAAAPSGGDKSGMGSVFSDLNKGSDVTKGLRKVDKSEMTHKNPSLRTSSVVTDDSGRPKSPAPPSKRPKPESMRTKKPPVKVLNGNKWTIENFENESAPVEIEASLQHSVLISRCTNTTIIIRGKANSIGIDNTKRLSLVVDSLVSSVDIVKSQNFALQVLGVVPSVLMDQIDGAQIYLSKESIRTKVTHSQCAGINLNVMAGGGGEDEDEDYKEIPASAQIEMYYDPQQGKLVESIVSQVG